MGVGLRYLGSLDNAVEGGKRNMKGLMELRVAPIGITAEATNDCPSFLRNTMGGYRGICCTADSRYGYIRNGCIRDRLMFNIGLTFRFILGVGLALVLGVVKLFQLMRAGGTTVIFYNLPYLLETLRKNFGCEANTATNQPDC